MRAKRRGDPVKPKPGRSQERSTHRNRSFGELFGRLLGMLGHHRKSLGFALGALAVSTLASLIPLYAPKIVFDHVLDDQPAPGWLQPALDAVPSSSGRLGVLIAVSLALTAVSIAVGLLGRWTATRISKLVGARVRRQVFEHAASLPLPRVQALRSGGVSSILRDDASAPGSLVFEMLYNPARAILQLLGSLAILAVIEVRLLGLALVLLPTVWLTHRTWIARVRPLWREVRRTRRDIDARSTESFAGIRVVRGFSRSGAETAAFARQTHLMARQELHTWWWMRGVDTAWALLIPVATAALLYYGSLRIIADRAAVEGGLITATQAFTVGGLVAFLTYLGALLGPIASLAATATNLQNSLAGLDRTLDLLDEPTELEGTSGTVIVNDQTTAGRVTFEAVGFAYPGSDTPALEGIELDALPGQTVALVGPSGAGKSTLCNLVARFYSPTSGRLLLDGTDVSELTIDSYRRLLGIVEQDIFLFDGTIRQNIAYARRDADQHAVERAAKLAHADEFIDAMDEGYDTIIGERGVRLSGGQRQRLAIARAILADPKILILDEATSNLDSHSEQLIQNALTTLRQERTSFIIAHRLSTIRTADQILVLQGGRVVQRGTHDELAEQDGLYRSMLALQQDSGLAVLT